MKSRQTNGSAIAAANAGFSTATAYRIEADPPGKTPLIEAREWLANGAGDALPGCRDVSRLEARLSTFADERC
jgi:hypothetical protein